MRTTKHVTMALKAIVHLQMKVLTVMEIQLLNFQHVKNVQQQEVSIVETMSLTGLHTHQMDVYLQIT